MTKPRRFFYNLPVNGRYEPIVALLPVQRHFLLQRVGQIRNVFGSTWLKDLHAQLHLLFEYGPHRKMFGDVEVEPMQWCRDRRLNSQYTNTAIQPPHDFLIHDVLYELRNPELNDDDYIWLLMSGLIITDTQKIPSGYDHRPAIFQEGLVSTYG